MPKKLIKSNKTRKPVILSSKHNNSKKYFKFTTSFSSLLANSHFLSLAKIFSLLSPLNYSQILPTIPRNISSLLQAFLPSLQILTFSLWLKFYLSSLP